MWRNENDLSDEELLAEFKAFKIFSGPYQCRILGVTGDDEFPYFPMGSGGYLKYRGNYYLITNEHVARQAKLTDVRALCVSNGQKCANLIDLKMDRYLDIAVFKVGEACLGDFCGKDFLNESFIEQNPLEHLEKHNPVFLHATPGENYELNPAQKEINLTTLPYLTFAKGYGNDLFEIDINIKGLNENQEVADVPSVFGMSGSFAYSHYPKSLVPYKCFGMLCSGEKSAGSLWVLDMRLVLQFIDTKFI